MGENTEKLVKEILDRRPHPQQGFRSCLALLKLESTFGSERLERACTRAVRFKAFSYKSVLAILKNNLDQDPPDDEPQAQQELPLHENLRGASYYH